MKIRSMTGFGRARGRIGTSEFGIEMKTVNNRFLDVKTRLPVSIQPLEQDIVGRIREKISRGRIECAVTEVSLADEAAEIQVNWPLARRYKDALEALGRELKLPGEVGIELIARQRDVLLPPPPPDVEELLPQVSALLDKALAELTVSREREGDDLAEDMLARLETIEKLTGEVEGSQPQIAEKLRERLLARLEELKAAPDLDPQRFAQEAAYLADRADVAEEVTRLRSHLAKFRETLGGGGTVGRKLDFLVQEMNREANTIGSKASHAEVQHRVVEIKSELERVREQVQNIE